MPVVEPKHSESKSDLTPMIDAVFLLIIFFLCIDFRMLESKVTVQLPTDRGSGPDESEPVQSIDVRVHCDARGEPRVRYPDRGAGFLAGRRLVQPVALVGHQIHWTVGPKRIETSDELRRLLRECALDPGLRIEDASDPGQTRLAPIVITPLEGATYGDVAQTADLARAAGFEQLQFGQAPGRR